MFNFKSLECYNCKSTIFNLPDFEVVKLNGLTFQCETCGRKNMLDENKFHENKENHSVHNKKVLNLYKY